ncbi:MAG: T9SS type A sorting domain-containing protein, partial [Ignavibacterium sp.]|uniref:T9SS type A sorting domain-containing protein n=1 Tax=Ignavibacterium sp. TaxID=2651167 RepID=UPI003296B595
IEPWNYYISWTGGNPMKYPESWFWYYHGESVMALTYEDMYQCSGTGNFNVTANAILLGVMDYMNIPTEVELSDNSIPSEFTLEQNYPNPFNPSTKISWQSPVGSWQTIKLYDIMGREIETIIDGYFEAGYHSTLYNVNSSLSSGVYFYRLQAGNFTQTKKMILMR